LKKNIIGERKKGKEKINRKKGRQEERKK